MRHAVRYSIVDKEFLQYAIRTGAPCSNANPSRQILNAAYNTSHHPITVGVAVGSPMIKGGGGDGASDSPTHLPSPESSYPPRQASQNPKASKLAFISLLVFSSHMEGFVYVFSILYPLTTLALVFVWELFLPRPSALWELGA